MRLILLVIHATVAAMWLGSMGYSLFVVQPKLSRLAGGDPVRIEEMHRELAQGNRWPVVALITTLWATGALLAMLTGVTVVLVAKAILLLGATALFWWVSWRAWPRRVFALPEELPDLQRRFRRVAELMFALVGLAFVLAIAAQ